MTTASAARAVRRHQHGGDPARPHRVRVVRAREGRLHRRQHAQRRPLRAGRGRHAVPRRDRRHADGGADAAAARAAAGRIHDRRRPHADQGRRAHHRRHQQGPAHPHPAGAVPRGSVLPAQRRAAAAAAVARAQPRTCPTSSVISSAWSSAKDCRAKQIDQAALDRLKRHRWPGNVRELENLARRLAALYPQETIYRVSHRLPNWRSRRSTPAAEEPAHGRGSVGGGRTPPRRLISRASATDCRRPASITASCARSNTRC